ncbi:MAG TPA: acyltransferase [Verrucomicrobiae bacterium]|jgi:peptidoglycan/LPS O-acetylase OafA/YrhL|nr:acyltransferase [Verrucomicrobiae bacterium]
MNESQKAACLPFADSPFGSTPKTSAVPPSKLIQSPGDRSLDQWRGLALVLVLISHGFHYPVDRVPGVGRAGVNLFFFISGILVFRSLSKGPEHFWQGAKFFWKRRLKRLIPAKYFYLIFIAILLLLLPATLAPREFAHSYFDGLPSSFLYYRNYYIPTMAAYSPATHLPENLAGHLWSLACEMQFYLLAPLIFFLGGRALARRLMVFGLILMAMLAAGAAVLGRSDYNPYTFQVAAWPMMAGFFFAFLHVSFPQFIQRLGPAMVGIGIFSFAALTIALLSHPASYTMHKQVVVLAGTLFVAGCTGCYVTGIAPRNLFGDIFHYLGNRTYSIYLWQQPLTIGGLMAGVFHPWGALLAIPIGALSFRYFERPFMSKFKKPQDASRR